MHGRIRRWISVHRGAATIAGLFLLLLIYYKASGGLGGITEQLSCAKAGIDAYFEQMTSEADQKRNATLYENEKINFALLSDKIAGAEGITYKRVIKANGVAALPDNAYEYVYEGFAGYAVDYCSGATDEHLFRKISREGAVYLASLSDFRYAKITDMNDQAFNLKSGGKRVLLSVSSTIVEGGRYASYEVEEDGRISKWLVDGENFRMIRYVEDGGVAYEVFYGEITFGEAREDVFDLSAFSTGRYTFDDVLRALAAGAASEDARDGQALAESSEAPSGGNELERDGSNRLDEDVLEEWGNEESSEP